MNVELTNESETLIQILGDRIEELERTLLEDEDFCNKDIDATYQAGVNYLKAFQERFNEKLNELKIKLEHIRKENVNISKQNKKQFDDEMDIVNDLFSSGKHHEASEKLKEYEKKFEQRTTVIQNIPKLFMRNIDIDQYFSFDKPFQISQPSPIVNKRNSPDHVIPIVKPQYHSQHTIEAFFRSADDDENNENEFNKSPKCTDIQRSSSYNSNLNKQNKSPNSTVPVRPLGISTRLLPSPNSKIQIATDHRNTSPLLVQSNNSNSRINFTTHTSSPSSPSSPTIIQSSNQRQMVPVKNLQTENFIYTFVANFEYVRDTSVLMTCNEDYIVIGRNRSNKLSSWSLSAIDRFNRIEKELNWNDYLITSIGFINKKILYIFAERCFIMYSMESLSTINSSMLSNDYNQNSEMNRQSYSIGTVYDKHIYYVFLNNKSQWILSIFELETTKHVYDYNLTENFSAIKRFIHICINDRYVSFLVEIDGRRFSVIFCSRNKLSLMALKERVFLSYAENPISICSVYVYHVQKYFFFVNDPSVKVIHLLTNEKYLKASTIVAHAFDYIPENQQLLFLSNDGIYSIDMEQQMHIFSKFH